MQIRPADFKQDDYRLLDELHHDNMLPFLNQYLKKRTKASVMYVLLNLLCFFLIAIFFYKFKKESWFGFSVAFAYLFFGILFTVVLIPVHELLHAFAYKCLGAKQTSFDANFRKFYFMAMADQFVVNRKAFTIVALAPFVVISLLLLTAMLFVSPVWMFFFAGTLFMHTACCSGDFALLSYFNFHGNKTVLTYDDKAKGVSYFYEAGS